MTVEEAFDYIEKHDVYGFEYTEEQNKKLDEAYRIINEEINRQLNGKPYED